MNRRDFAKSASGIVAGAAILSDISAAQAPLPKTATVRDQLWLFGVPQNAEQHLLHRRSLMTPVEGAYYLGIPNVIMIQVIPHQPGENYFRPYEFPLQQYTMALQSLERFAWSITGSSGYTTREYRKEVLELANTTPNCVGLYMDDFFFTGKKQQAESRQAALTIDELREVRQQARSTSKKLEIWVTYYTMLLGLSLQDYLDLIDVLTIWTWKSEELKDLESNFRKIEALGPRLKKTLGCYFFDYTTSQPLTIAQMKHQCELGLEWLRQGKIEGMVFLGNCQEDQGFESVEWARSWIQKVGDIAV